MADIEADKVKFETEADVRPLTSTFKKIFAPITKMGPAIIRIPKVLQGLREDIKSGIPERFEKACDKLETVNEKFVMDFGSKILEQAKKQREIATAQAAEFTRGGAPAIVTQNNEVRILTEKEIIKEQVKLQKTQQKIGDLQKERLKLNKEAQSGDKEVIAKLQKVGENLAKLEEVQQGRQNRLGDRAQPERGGGDEEDVDYIPGPIREFGEGLTEIVTGPFTAFQGLANNIKEFAKPFKAIGKSFKNFGGDDEKDDKSPLGFLSLMFLKLGKVIKMVATFFMITLLPIMIKIGLVIAVVVGAFKLIKGAIELLMEGLAGAYNYVATWVPGMDPIGATPDEKTVGKADDKKITYADGSTTQRTDEELAAEQRIAQRQADVGGPLKGMKVDMYGNNLQDKADELKKQQDMRNVLKDRVGSNPMMNIINNQNNSSSTVENKVSPSPSNDVPSGAITVN